MYIDIICLGIFFGVIAGLLPGVGMVTLTVLLLPLTSFFTVFDLVSFYTAALITTQFTGSVVATHFGIPGEPSSILAIIDGHSLHKQGKTSQAIMISAYGSFVGGIVSLMFLFLLGKYLDEIFSNFNTHFNLILMCFVITLLLLTRSKNSFDRFGFPAIGIFLGIIGPMPDDTFDHFATFGISSLEYGIPMMPLLLGLYTFPLLLELKNQSHDLKVIPKFKWSGINIKLKHTVVAFVYSIIGFVLGFIPGIGVDVVSNITHNLQKKIKDNNELNLMAAESSNNSAAFAIVLPLLLFGLPTSSSQAILYEMIVQKSFLLGPLSFDQFLGVMAPTIAIASLSGFLIAGPMSSFISNIFTRFYKYINHLLMIFLLFLMVWFAHVELNVWMYIIVFLSSTVFGVAFKGYNVLKIIYFYIIADFVFENIIRLGYMQNIL
jgi:putative tricarboxylic transport membrane protein